MTAKNTLKGKTIYTQDVYLYDKNKIQKIGLLYNKTINKHMQNRK